MGVDPDSSNMLLRPVQSIAEVPQPWQDELVLVQSPVDCRRVDLDIRMLLLDQRDPFRRGDDADHANGAPEGIALVERQHPDVEIYTPAIDRGLNEHKFILPGLGDFGDRLYGT